MRGNSSLFIIIAVLSAITIVFIILLFSSRALNRKRTRRILADKKRIIETIIYADSPLDPSELGIKPPDLFRIYRELTSSVACPDLLIQKFTGYFIDSGIQKKISKKLRSRNRIKRSEAALELAFIPCDRTRRALESALENEKYYYLKIFIIHALVETGDEASIPYVLQTLIGAPRWYQEKVYSILGDFGARLHDFLVNLKTADSKEIKMVIATFAGYYFAPDLTARLLEFLDDPDSDVSSAASDACLRFYPEFLCSEKFIRSHRLYIKKNAVKAAGVFRGQKSAAMLLDAMNDTEIYFDCVAALSGMIVRDNALFNDLLSQFLDETGPLLKSGMAEVLSQRIDFILATMRTDNSDRLKRAVREIVSCGNTSGVIDFLNENSDPRLEERICGILADAAENSESIKNEFRLYLKQGALERMNLTRSEPRKGETRHEEVRTGLLKVFLCGAFLWFPAVFIAKYAGTFSTAGIYGSVKNFIYLFNYSFAFYGITLNSIYLLLLAFSFYGSNRQLRCWRMKDDNFLFKQGILPSISIIAAAYGEEATIVESVNSLLNLKYPDYEVIVVNDGSIDSTLQTLIENFELERTDTNIYGKLRTGPVRGIYTNKYIPNLIVVDKVNGGKADSLNAGINMATREFFCGIDADSLLENDSLLKMTSPFLDTDREIIATGGNIIPVNGCSVDKGYITSVKIPGRFLARLQTMEYIRSFIAGRVGWATLDCLLVISGAFGLFNKTAVIESRGYLTGKEKFHKDTVGEDMELVVRLIKNSSLQGRGGRINYVFNANCWTEVPEDLSILRKQRDRWQRGLLDIMTFHIGMLFNPRFKEVGLIAFPYFIIFEVIGPWIEAQGLIIFLLALLMGLLDTQVILLLFTGTILLGIAVSVISFYIMERGDNHFSARDMGMLILYAFLENFGIRQYFSISRLGGYINALRNRQGWGKMVRRGFRKTV